MYYYTSLISTLQSISMFLEGAHQNDKQETTQKNSIFRKNIRKEQLQSYFQERRKQLLQAYQDNEVQDITQQLKTAGLQHQFLKKMGCELAGEPNLSWKDIIQKLRKCVVVFKGQFDVWISQSIIKSLCSALKQQFKHLKLAPNICILFADMLYLSWDCSTNFSTKLMQYQLLPDIIALGYDKDLFSQTDRLAFLTLLSNICSYSQSYRLKVIRDGGGSILVDFGKEIIATNEASQVLVRKYILSSTGFIRIFKKAAAYSNPPLNIIYSLLPNIVHFYLTENIATRTVLSCLDCILETARLQKDTVYKSLLGYQNFIQKTLRFIIHQDIDIRTKAIHLISYFTFTNIKDLHSDLVAMKIFDFIHNSIDHLQSAKNKNFTKMALITLHNIALTSQKIREQLLQHPVFSFIVESSSSTLADVQKEALFCMSAVLQKIKFSSLRDALDKFQILRLMVRGLVDMQNLDARIAIEIISTLQRLIEHTQNQFFANSTNPIVDELQRVYNLSVRLQHIVNENKHKLVCEAANKLISFLSHIQCEELYVL